ncbi:MAG: WD40/YVTN/BNR-like repeat-containing protein, partial [Ignavibacteria bacterium]
PNSSSIRHYLALPTGELLAGGFVHDESSGGIFVSKDKGVTWKRVPDFVKEPSVLSFALNSANDIYALITFPFTCDSTVIYCSKDKGQSWFEVIKPDTVDIFNMLINRNNAFIINTAEGIFISEDRSSDWNLISPSSHDGIIISLGLDSDDNIYATFLGSGYKMTKVLVLSASTNTWYSIEGLNFAAYDHISTLIGKDRHIYLTTFSSGVYKTKQSIDSIISTN